MGWLDRTVTIASGQTESPEVDLSAVFPAGRLALTVIAPGTLPESVTVRIAKATGGTYGALQKDGADITFPAAKGTPVEINGAGAMKLVAGVAVAANRDFTVLAAPKK